MKKEIITIGLCMIFVSMILGCSFLGGGSKNETKLTVEQGIGVVGTLNVDELNPGLDGYISLTVRNNLGGESASKVYVSLDNVEPFKIFECGAFHNVSSEIRDCTGEFSLDKYLPYRSHGESKMFPGQELQFYWRLRAPSKTEISNIALRHPIYYDLEYDYRTTFTQNIIFMSQQEVLRRRQAGETYQVEGEASSGAGELRVTGATQQPVTYQFMNPSDITTTESEFPFSLSYAVTNEGKGLPLSDVVVLVELPRGKFDSAKKDIVADNETMSQYGWMKFKDMESEGTNCSTGSGEKNCSTWIQETYGNEFNSLFGTAITEDRLLVKIVKRTDFINEFSLYLPLKLVAGDRTSGMTALKNLQIPIQIYGFKMHNMYRYFTEGSSEIAVFPVRV
ncbi:MAG: hypothetical protein PHC66_01665 [Candidatus Nanoarchaeia archaeon]|nr:hypothetical protein [Candidatus Nanoarchaeia archaeon]MDD5238919.1 hypothetical protein [Candidatus Nanoarchaeia archaeon]